MNNEALVGNVMTERKTFFGTNRVMIERIDSLDEKWFVEFWIVRYYFLGIEVYTRKKEVVKHNNNFCNNRQKYAQ